MNKIDDGGLAFPGKRNQQVGKVSDFGFSDDDSPTFDYVQHPGMTLRDYFAAKAMQSALMTSKAETEAGFAQLFVKVSELSYAVADAMLKARES